MRGGLAKRGRVEVTQPARSPGRGHGQSHRVALLHGVEGEVSAEVLTSITRLMIRDHSKVGLSGGHRNGGHPR